MPKTAEPRQPVARERYVEVDGTALFVREIGDGHTIVVLHGGPDFDHTYLVPELDRLAASARLIYYDQRGRGRSAAVAAEEVGIESELTDLAALTREVATDPVALLGHSWGGVLAMEYAARYPERVSHLILMDTGPASASEWARFREYLRALRAPGEVEEMAQLAATTRYAAGDVQAELDYYRIHFRSTVPAEHLEELLRRLRAHFTEDTVLAARAIEQRLYAQTCLRPEYDLVPALSALPIPTLVLCGEHDFIPIEMAARIADAMPGARLGVIDGCGHFPYLERPDMVHELVAGLINAG